MHIFGTVLNHQTRDCRKLVLVLSGNSKVSPNQVISYIRYDGDKINLPLLGRHIFQHFFADHRVARNLDCFFIYILIVLIDRLTFYVGKIKLPFNIV